MKCIYSTAYIRNIYINSSFKSKNYPCIRFLRKEMYRLNTFLYLIPMFKFSGYELRTIFWKIVVIAFLEIWKFS